MDRYERGVVLAFLMERERAREKYIQLWKEIDALLDDVISKGLKIKNLEKEWNFTLEMISGEE